jgi:hypothetical protein
MIKAELTRTCCESSIHPTNRYSVRANKMAAADNGATTAIFIGGAISTVIGAALFATASDTNAQM